jgi:fructose-bisphosphate aldolase class 1
LLLSCPAPPFPPPQHTESIALENTEDNRRAYRELLCTTPGLGKYISGAIMFEETLFQSTSTGKKMTDCLKEQNIMPGIKVRGARGGTLLLLLRLGGV